MKSDNHTQKPRVNHKTGISFSCLGVIALSFDAVLIRLAEVSAPNAAFWRGGFIALALAVYLLSSKNLHQFAKLKKYGWAAFFVCCVYGFNAALFVFAVSYTTVANTVIILCSTPFFAALFSWLLLREKVDKMTWLTISVAVVGIVIVFMGANSSASLLGSSLALVLAFATGFLLSYLRRYPDLPRMPAVSVGALLSALILLPMATPSSLTPSSLTWLIVTGLFLKPVASVCMLIATRYIPSPEVSIFLLLETLMAPVWAWLLLGESVTAMTLAGGTTVLIMVAVHCWWEIKKEK